MATHLPAGQDFAEFARMLARGGEYTALLPVVEKELLHYVILNTMDEAGYLKALTFQGGTCLRLCYGSERCSEDLDFVGGVGFEPNDLAEIRERLRQAFDSQFSLNAEVGSPRRTRLSDDGDASAAEVFRWQIKVVIASNRPDIPKQRIKLEIASVPAHTRTLRALAVNYQGLPPSYGDVLLFCETPEEIAADKLKAFVTANNIRYRDIWDLRWLARQPGFDTGRLRELLANKLADYCVQDLFEAKLPQVLAALQHVVESLGFTDQMSRFLPASVLERTLSRDLFRQNIVAEIKQLYHAAGY